MKTTPLIVGLLVLITAGCERRMVRVQSPEPASTPSFTFGPTPDPNRINWEQRAKQIHIGMRRAEVERLLPPYSRPTAAGEDFRRFSTNTTINGGGQGVSYHVSDDIVVIVSYDYSGVPRDASGTTTDYSRPDNLVTAPVRIERGIK